MKLSTCLFDTQAYISYVEAREGPQPGWLSAVVLQELTAGSSGRSDLKTYLATCRNYQRQGRLIVPDADAWYQAGRLLNLYLSDLSRADKLRHRPSLDHRRKQNIIRDVLIAVSAKQHDVTVISDNEDFPTIRRYCNFKHIPAKEFFA
ncbi:MAG: PIN domain-containing protein [Blastocatellia bacterium]